MEKILMSILLKMMPKFLDGKKTYLAGAGFMLVGISQIVMTAAQAIAGVVDISSYAAYGVSIPPLSLDLALASFKSGALIFMFGFGMSGLRNAISKIITGGSEDVAISTK